MAAGGSGPRRARSAEAALMRSAARAGGASPTPRRRSERNATSPAKRCSQRKPLAVKKMTGSPLPPPMAKRLITVKKFIPQKQQITETAEVRRRSLRISSSKAGKENCPLDVSEAEEPGSSKVCSVLAPSCCLPGSTPGPAMAPRRIEEGVLSPVSITACDSPPQDERDLAMTKKVRRSYSRLDASFARSSLGYKASPGSDLSDTSTPNHAPEKRRSLFGFEKLLALDALADVSPVDKVAVREPPPATAGPGVSPREPDTDIPGISFAKEKRKRKKVPQIDKSKLDEWAAQMNAVFEEAEQFDLLVE